MKREQLENYLSKYLKCNEFNDYCPNGMQVEGCEEIKKIIIAVSASVDLFKQAIEEKADALIVHHGIIWNYERPIYRGGYRERIRLLLSHDLNLFAYHLPLDAHPEIGNNAQLCKLLKLKNFIPFGDYKGQLIGIRGEIEQTPKNEFFKKVETVVGREPIIFPFGPDKIKKVGVISGGAQKELKQAVDEGLDVFITGEVSEHIMYYAKEEKIHFISAGHYATEKFGIIALGKLLEKKYNLNIKFIDIPNPI
jgi:dinuclear metal center YbgI/SA1388 family protein